MQPTRLLATEVAFPTGHRLGLYGGWLSLSIRDLQGFGFWGAVGFKALVFTALGL